MKLIPGPIEGYKIVNHDMTCRGYKYEVGKIHELDNDKPLELCENGFHFCKYPSGVWTYYPDGRVFKVKAYDVLDQDETPGADYKLVCRKIELCEEISITGHSNICHNNTGYCNTGQFNTGDSNTGYNNAGHGNTGDSNTGDINTGHRNAGHGNTGHSNTGNSNTGYSNTGHWNVGQGNTGHSNTGSWNCGNYNTGFFCIGDAPVVFFGLPCNADRKTINYYLCGRLYDKLSQDNEFDIEPFLSLPNATVDRIKSVHEAFKASRKR